MDDTRPDEDTRVTCMTCINRQRGGCVRPRDAGLTVLRRLSFLEVGLPLATLPQHCPAWAPKPKPRAA